MSRPGVDEGVVAHQRQTDRRSELVHALNGAKRRLGGGVFAEIERHGEHPAGFDKGSHPLRKHRLPRGRHVLDHTKAKHPIEAVVDAEVGGAWIVIDQVGRAGVDSELSPCGRRVGPVRELLIDIQAHDRVTESG